MTNTEVSSVFSSDGTYSDSSSVKTTSDPGVLDLSVQKYSKSEFDKSSLGSPLQASVYPEILSQNNAEPNNNDSKTSNFQTPIAKSFLHHLPMEEEFNQQLINSSSKRKSPGIEGTRFDRLTPPSESTSPTKGSERVPPLHGAFYNGVPALMNSPYMWYPSQLSVQSPLSVQSSLSVPSSLPFTHTLTNPTFGSPPGSDSSSLMNEVYQPQPSSMDPEELKKIARPFKAFPKEPLSSLDLYGIDEETRKSFIQFRNALEFKKRMTEGTNIKMRRTNKSPNVPSNASDDNENSAYRERRRKNNEAAKRSRDARRQKEDEIALRASFFEKKYTQAMAQLKVLSHRTDEELSKKEAENRLLTQRLDEETKKNILLNQSLDEVLTQQRMMSQHFEEELKKKDVEISKLKQMLSSNQH